MNLSNDWSHVYESSVILLQNKVHGHHSISLSSWEKGQGNTRSLTTRLSDGCRAYNVDYTFLGIHELGDHEIDSKYTALKYTSRKAKGWPSHVKWPWTIRSFDYRTIFQYLVYVYEFRDPERHEIHKENTILRLTVPAKPTVDRIGQAMIIRWSCDADNDTVGFSRSRRTKHRLKFSL